SHRFGFGGAGRRLGGRGRPRSRRCFGFGRSAARFERKNPGTLGYLVANPDPHLLHHACLRRRHVHRRLVGLERNERVFLVDGVAGLYQDFDHRNVLEVADVGGCYFDAAAHGKALTLSVAEIKPCRQRRLKSETECVDEWLRGVEHVVRAGNTHGSGDRREAASGRRVRRDQVRICPSPKTTYLSEVSPSSPTGPRACSLSVEMPISAPSPYS